MGNVSSNQTVNEQTYAPPLTPDEAAEYLKVSKRTVLELARRGDLPGCKIGNRWRFSLSQLARFVDMGG